MQKSFEYRIDKAIGAATVRVVHENGAAFDSDLVSHIAELPGVAISGGRLNGSLTFIRADGGKDDKGRTRRVTASARGVDLDPDDRFMQIELKKGEHIEKPDEIVIGPLVANRLKVQLGDVIRVQRFGPPVDLRVVGIQDRPILGGLQRPRVQLLRQTLAEALNTSDRMNVYSIALDDDIDDTEAWIEENKETVSAPLILESTERIKSGFHRQVRGGRIAFVLAAMLGFIACAVIVATGMTTALAEQQREMAIVRLIGASRRHLFQSQIIAGFILCFSGGVLGIPIGLGLAWLLTLWYAKYLPAGFHPSLEAAGLSLIGAAVAGVLGALLPAWLASRVTPISALAVHAQPPRTKGIVLCAIIGVGLLISQILLLLLIPDTQIRFWVYAIVGGPLIVGGFFLLTPGLAWLLLPTLGSLLERILSLPPRILQRTMRATPYRLGLTAGALMVGMAILTSTWSNGESLLQSVMERVRFADAFVFKTTGLTAAEQERLTQLPGVAAASPVGYLPLRVESDAQLGVRGFGPQNVVCVGFEVESFLALNRVEWIRGTPESAVPYLLEGNSILVAEEFLTARQLDIGDSVSLGPPGKAIPFTIVGVVSAAGLDVATQFFGIRSLYLEHAASCVFMDFEAVDRHFNTREAYILQIVLEPDMTEEDERFLGLAAAESVPGIRFSSGRAIQRIIEKAGNTILGVTSSVAFAALLLASVAVGNVVAAGITARKFEFGVLRAVGSPRWLMARLVLGEVFAMAILASIVGTIMGMHLAWVGTTLYRDLGGIILSWTLPIGPVIAGAIVLLLLTVLAATAPIISLLRKPTRALVASGR